MIREYFLTVCIWFLGSFLPQNLTAQLSSNAQISLLTCGPGDDLYALFGHSAIRVYDPASGLDEVYNYGTFDWEDPHFYQKFLKGKLLYWVDKESMDHFLGMYRYLERFVKEEIINLDSAQINTVHQALKENYKIENRYYLYDFLFDNCSTRINDIIEKKIGPIQFSDTNSYSFRDLLHQNLKGREWTQLGIDLIIGSKADRLATARQQMFLPDYLSANLSKAKNASGQSALLPHRLLLDIPVKRSTSYWILPFYLFSFLLVLELILLKSIPEKLIKCIHLYDLFWMTILPLCFFVIALMWFGTDHKACSNNLNLLIFSPLVSIWWIPFLLKKEKSLAILSLLISLSYITLPFAESAQDFNRSLFPIGLITILKLGRIGNLGFFRKFL